MYTNDGLLMSFRKGRRNGNWRKLSGLKKALYRASLWDSMGSKRKLYQRNNILYIPKWNSHTLTFASETN